MFDLAHDSTIELLDIERRAMRAIDDRRKKLQLAEAWIDFEQRGDAWVERRHGERREPVGNLPAHLAG